MDLKILVACHKPYATPEQSIYCPIEVGTTAHETHLEVPFYDNTGDNISDKNKNYCELTAIYWAWKNLNADVVGLVHYRRYFGRHLLCLNKQNNIAREKDFARLLEKHPVIMPKPRHYFIESNYSQYIHAHHAEDLAVTRQILEEKYPEYLPGYDLWMGRTYGHHFNMFVMKKPLLDQYCEWLFDVLFELEKRLDISRYDSYNQRVFGFVSERLMDCWLETNHIPYSEMPMVNMERQHWVLKILRFLKRKFIRT